MKKQKIGLVFLGILLLLFATGCGGKQITAHPEQQQTTVTNQASSSDKLKAQQESQNVSQSEENGKVENNAASSTKNGGAKGNNSETRTSESARLVVTHNYGGKVVFDQTVPLEKDANGLDFSAMYLDVETAYGGSFINGINGTVSGYTGHGIHKIKKDWFLYVNGVLSSCGAGDYKLKKGDVVWWDYHDWGENAFTPVMLGAFPRPFSHQLEIVFSPAGEDYAQNLAQKLTARGLTGVEVKPFSDEVVFHRSNPVIIVGVWGELSEYGDINSLNKNYRKAGIFCRFDSAGLRPVNTHFQEAGDIYTTASACISATGTGAGDKNPLGLVIAYDEAGLDKAVKLLGDGGISPGNAWGLIIDSQGCHSLPVR